MRHLFEYFSFGQAQLLRGVSTQWLVRAKYLESATKKTLKQVCTNQKSNNKDDQAIKQDICYGA